MRLVVPVVLAAMAAAAGLPAAEAVPPASPRASLGVTGGLFEFTDDGYREPELGVQYRGRARWWLLHPMIGGMLNDDEAFNLYAGVGIDLPLGRALIRLSFAPGYYHKGNGKDLGLALEFRSSFEIAWCFGDGWRLGVEIYHLSNAQLGDINPGDGSLVLGLTVPLGASR